MRNVALCGLLFCGCVAASGQGGGPPANPLVGGDKFFFGMMKNNILKAAAEMPEENYSFKPVDSVRTYGQLVGHVADAQYAFCGAVSGEKPEHKSVEKTVTAKAEIVEQLKTAFAFCDKTYAGMTDAQAPEAIDFFGHKAAKLTVLSINNAHLDEHYGNMVTYLRIKGLVPPSSQP